MARHALLVRWDDVPLENVTEMIARKVIAAGGDALVQVYLKRGALVPIHTHPGDQWIYVLQGSLAAGVDGRELVARDGEVLRVAAGSSHQVEALDDTFALICGPRQ